MPMLLTYPKLAAAGLLAGLATLCSAQPLGPLGPELPVQVRRIESFVSPGHLFPQEGTQFSQRRDRDARVVYRPLEAYDSPQGKLVGKVHLANVHCVGADNPGKECSEGLVWYFQSITGQRQRMPVAEFGYETFGLVTYQKSVSAGGKLWSRIDIANGPVWVVTTPGDVVSYESKVWLVDTFDTWCTAPGQCAPIPPRMADQARRVLKGEIAVGSCFVEPYQVHKVVEAGGTRYYRVSGPAQPDGTPVPGLPESGYVPVRNRDGTHTGTFYARGC